MTLGELYEAVACLGFETALDDEVLRRGFYAVIGRALETVGRLRPTDFRVALSHVAPDERRVLFEPRRLSDGETLTLPLPESAEQISLSVFGVGSACLADGSGMREERFSSPGESLLSFRCRGARELTVKAERDVTVGAISLSRALSPLAELLPLRGVRYDVKTLCPGFAAFSSPALYLDGRPYLGAYTLLGSALVLGLDAPSGLYELSLRLAMPIFSAADDPSRELPLPPETAALLPELVASFIWLDDAPEKAAYYASIYQRGAAQLRAEARRGAAETVCCPNGW